VDSTSPRDVRSLVRRAQVLLAVAAVVIAVAVGAAAAATTPAPPSGHQLTTSQGTVVAAAETDPARGSVPAGLVAGSGTLAACWALLAVGAAFWRFRSGARADRE
jgi:hypothetical protein